MKKQPIFAFLIILGTVFMMSGCGLFGGEDACDSIVCTENDVIQIEYRSAADSTTGLFDPGQFSLDELSIVPLLRDKNGPAPFVLKAKLGPMQKATIHITADENLRGIALRLANFAPDTILMTTGLRPADPCCTETTTVSQLLANGQPIPTIGSMIPVIFYK